jgi:hypothetical protein
VDHSGRCDRGSAGMCGVMRAWLPGSASAPAFRVRSDSPAFANFPEHDGVEKLPDLEIARALECEGDVISDAHKTPILRICPCDNPTFGDLTTPQKSDGSCAINSPGRSARSACHRSGMELSPERRLQETCELREHGRGSTERDSSADLIKSRTPFTFLCFFRQTRFRDAHSGNVIE